MMWNRRASLFWFATGVIALIGFLALASVIHRPEFIQRDLEITRWFDGPDGSPLGGPLVILSDFGRSILIFIVFEVAVWLWLKRRRGELAVLLTATIGGFALNMILRGLLQGPRPVIEDPGAIIEHTGFPSGHTMMATLTYGLLLYGALDRIPARYRWLMAGGLGLLLLGIGFTRLFFGVHYLSDVAGGYLAGWAWLAACILATQWLRSSRLQVERSNPSQTATHPEL
jgi:undecaprenyl-diphosphatase